MSAQFFIKYTSSDKRHFENNRFNFNIEKNASCSVLNHKESSNLIFESSEINLDHSAQFDATYVGTKTQITRHDIEVNLNDESANCQLNGLSILSKDHVFSFKTRVHHRSGLTESKQHFKNILFDKANSEYNGLVEVYQDSQEIDSYQLNRNLVLSDDAKAFSRPQLRIFADDVKCSHGSTTGQIEESEILYLTSRGLTRKQAHDILIFGFADEVLEETNVESYQSTVERRYSRFFKRSKYIWLDL